MNRVTLLRVAARLYRGLPVTTRLLRERYGCSPADAKRVLRLFCAAPRAQDDVGAVVNPNINPARSRAGRKGRKLSPWGQEPHCKTPAARESWRRLQGKGAS